MIIDSHVHIFNKKIISNVSENDDLVSILNLQTESASNRSNTRSLFTELTQSGVDACLMLPTTGVKDVKKTNAACMKMAEESSFLYTAGTLHPYYENNLKELIKMQKNGIRGIKLCSFSQGFSMNRKETFQLFDLIKMMNEYHHGYFFVVLDTFYLAHRYFGTPKKNNTTPEDLNRLVFEFPRVNIVAAHMGGLLAPFDEIRRNLQPAKNLFLDTSNAAHTLTEKEFVYLLQSHGAKQILFGTDWPWFRHDSEKNLIDRLLDLAGFNREDKKQVFGGNISSLLGIH